MFLHQPSGLYLTLHRAYDPFSGRWLSRDPAGEVGGINLYAYVDGDPINNVDPLGLIARPSVPSPNPAPPNTPNNPNPGSPQCNSNGNGNGGNPIQNADYYNHAIERMNQRGISPGQVEHALQFPSSSTEQENGNTLTEGENGTSVVTDPYGWVVTVW